jgi:cell division protein FtsI/penicillin-binding protein 2
LAYGNKRTDTRRSSYDEGHTHSSRPKRKQGGSFMALWAKRLGVDRRLVVLFTVLIVLCLCVVGRLVYLQILRGPALAEEASNNRTNEIVLPAKRGTIYDRNGNVLAMSQAATTIYANPNQVSDKNQAAQILYDVLGGNKQDYLDILNQDTTFAYVKRKVDPDQADQVREKLSDSDIAGIYYLDDSKRVYPYGALAGQILGMLGTDNEGLTGLELYYNDVLSGTDGSMTLETGADGTPIAGGISETNKATDGSDIVLSLDIDVQTVMENTLRNAPKTYDSDSASAMVTNPKTGEILATCSTPFADLTDPDSLTNDELKLRMVSDIYEPGSIFKIITATSGFMNNTFTADTTYDVPVQIKVGDDYVTDSVKRNAMRMSVRTVMERSSNVGAILMARDVGAEQFSSTVKSLGLGQRTGIDYPGELAGDVADYDDYTSMTLSDMAFGQGLAVPQVQMVQAVGAIANGGTLATPHFLIQKDGQDVTWAAKGQVCTPEVSQQISDLLQDVVAKGTAKQASVAGYKVAAKTGTAQMSSQDSGYAKGIYMSSLIGYANADDPDILVYVGLNGTPHFAESSSSYMFSSIMSEALKDEGVPRAS